MPNVWSLALMEKYPGVLPVTQGMSLPQHVVGLCSGCAWPNPAHLLVRSGALMGTSIFLMEARPSTSPWKGRGGCFSAGIRETEIVILVLLECPGLSECSCAPCAHAGLEAGVDQETLVFSNCPGCLLRFSSWFFLFIFLFFVPSGGSFLWHQAISHLLLVWDHQP